MLFGKHINRYYLKYLPILLLGMLSLIAVDYMQLIIPNLYQLLINGINEGQAEVDGVMKTFDLDFLLDEICRPMLLVIVTMVFGRFLWRVCFLDTSVRVETDLRSRMFEHTRTLSQQYYQVNKVGDMMSLFTNDLETIQDCFAWGILMFFDALFLGTLAIIKMWKMHPILTGFAMIPLAILMVGGMIVDKYMTMRWEKRQEAFSKLSDFSQENFAGIAVIKAFVKEAKELHAFRKLNKNNEDANVAFTKLSVKLDIAITLLVESVVCVILGYGGYLVYIGRFNAGQLVEFIGYFTATVWPVMAVAQLIGMHAQGTASLNRIGKLLDAKPDVVDKEGVEELADVRGDVEMKNLTFRYPGGEYDVLENVSLKINAGENVGIIGKTGSGKTTIVDLLLRTYNVPNGTVFIDGHDVNTVKIADVRKACAYVPQDNFLFSDTIANNIAFASDTNDRGAVEEAAKMADIHDNISEFALGYETVLGERGVTVSGGQKQRISIARALMKNAPVLILDDSVSAVDVKTEEKILSNLKTLRKGKTTILIAHRITTVEKMDKVIFVDEGRIVAIGPHAELCKTCPDYRLMVDLQRLDSEEHELEKARVERREMRSQALENGGEDDA